MTPANLAKAGALLYGTLWKAPLARDLGVSRRHLDRWAVGESPIPTYVEGDVRDLLTQRGVEIATFLRARG